MSELQAQYGQPEAPYSFDLATRSIEQVEAEFNQKRQYNANQISIDLFLDWMSDGSECIWYASIGRLCTVSISLPENSWEIYVRAEKEAGGVFPKGVDLASKKQYVQKQVNKVITDLTL